MNPNPLSVQAALPRILVVDDTPDNLFLMNGLFEDRYQVLQAPSGQDALKIVMSDNPPDMVLLDIMMPDMDGYEVLRRIRQHPPTANIPVIFLTALAGAQDERLGMNLGAADYLIKPVDPDLVIRRVEAHVQATAHAKRMETLGEKLSAHLSPEAWTSLFQGAGLETIRFEQRPLTVLFAENDSSQTPDTRQLDRFAAEVDWLATRHHGTVDPFVHGATVVYFDDPVSCVRMALELQRNAAPLQLRIGLHTGLCDIGTFRSEFHSRCTLIGLETRLAAKVAAAAAIGSVAVSAQTAALVNHDVQIDAAGCLVKEEFHDSDLPPIQLTAPSAQVTVAKTGFASRPRH